MLCFIHCKNNIVNHLTSVGFDEPGRKCIIADIFGQQQGTTFEEGLVDSEDENEFQLRLDTLQSVWKERHGEKGLQFDSWFVNHKAKLVKNKMLRPVRIRAGLGNPPKPFFANRVECGNSMISSETGHTESAVDKFVGHVQGLSERQARNVRWAIVNKGPYRLHPSLQHFETAEEDWLLMSREEKDSYIKMVLNSNVALTSELKETENHTDAIQVDESDHCLSMSGLSVLAEAALSELSHGKESSEPTDETKRTPMITLDEFRKYFNTRSDGTVEGIYKKAVELLGRENGIVRAPGCGEKVRMVESRRLKERPHLVTPGKKKGE